MSHPETLNIEQHPENSTLPRLSEITVRRYEMQRPTFDTLYDGLAQADPIAARWLRDETERMAPADPAKKQEAASMALALFHMLETELFVDRMNWLTRKSADTDTEPVAGVTRLPIVRNEPASQE